MGVETAVALGFTALSATGNLLAANEQQEAAEQQARITEAESAEAARVRRIELKKFEAVQRGRFLSSGVTIEGSPLLVLEETRREGEKEVRAIRRFGAARAETFRQTGRAAALRGITGAVTAVGRGVQQTF